MWETIVSGWNTAKSFLGFDEGDILREGIKYYRKSKDDKPSAAQRLQAGYKTDMVNLSGDYGLDLDSISDASAVSTIKSRETNSAEIYSAMWTRRLQNAITMAKKTSQRMPTPSLMGRG
tara:strand:+ start:901 stop:1257 length:357 start_codon:yes stop_codon:yes gene_type:complete